MESMKGIAILIVCFALWGFTMDRVSAEEISLKIEARKYYMISSPYMPEDRDPQVSLEDDLGPYDETQWRLFRYDTANSKYAELKSPDWDPDKHDFDFGRGYWIISIETKNIGIEGDPIGGPIEQQIILEHEGDGWNQIANVFDSDFPIANLYVVRINDPDPVQNRAGLIDPTNNDLTYLTLQEFEDGSYIDIPTIGKTDLEVGKSYWLRVQPGIEEDVILWFVPSAQSQEGYLSERFFEKVAQQDNPPDPPPGITGSFSSGSSGGSVGCFIATAVYRDYDHPNVRRLREFRDRYLLANSLGRMFVAMYYRWSPNVAKFVANRSLMKALTRFTLMPIVGLSSLVIKMNVYGFFIVLAFPILMGFFLLMESGGGGGRCKPKFSIKSEEGKRKR